MNCSLIANLGHAHTKNPEASIVQQFQGCKCLQGIIECTLGMWKETLTCRWQNMDRATFAEVEELHS